MPGFDDGSGRYNGTSMASPECAGAVALLLSAAVQEDLDSSFVFVDDQGTARRVPVTRGFAKGGRVEITGDLNEGDVVATDGSFKLFEGAAIARPRPESDTGGRQRGRRSSGGR